MRIADRFITECSILARIMFTVGLEWDTYSGADTDRVMDAIGGADGLIRKAKEWELEYHASGRMVGDFTDDLEQFTLDKISALMRK